MEEWGFKNDGESAAKGVGWMLREKQSKTSKQNNSFFSHSFCIFARRFNYNLIWQPIRLH